MLVRFTLSDDDLGQNLFRNVYYIHDIMIIFVYLAILCALFGMVKWPLQRLSDLQLGDQKAILNHLVFKYIYRYMVFFYSILFTYQYVWLLCILSWAHMEPFQLGPLLSPQVELAGERRWWWKGHVSHIRDEGFVFQYRTAMIDPT